MGMWVDACPCPEECRTVLYQPFRTALPNEQIVLRTEQNALNRVPVSERWQNLSQTTGLHKQIRRPPNARVAREEAGTLDASGVRAYTTNGQVAAQPLLHRFANSSVRYRT